MVGIVTVSLTGCGHSDKPSHPMTVGRCADLLMTASAVHHWTLEQALPLCKGLTGNQLLQAVQQVAKQTGGN